MALARPSGQPHCPVPRIASLSLLVRAAFFRRAETLTPTCLPEKPDLTFKPEGVLTFFSADAQPITRIAVEIAETDSARERGLMERTGLPEKGGMLFLMDEEKIQSFWMYNTPLPLDILFVNDSLEIVTIRKRTTSYSQDLVSSTAPARLVVEVKAGFADRYGLAEGQRITWRREAFSDAGDS